MTQQQYQTRSGHPRCQCGDVHVGSGADVDAAHAAQAATRQRLQQQQAEGLAYRLRVERRLYAMAEEDAAHEAVRQDSIERGTADTRPYCCKTHVTGMCATCTEEAAMEAENRWQHGRRDPERWPVEDFQNFLPCGCAGGAYGHIDTCDVGRCDRCGERFNENSERAEIGNPAGNLVVHVACMRSDDSLA